MEVGANMEMPDEQILTRGREMLGLIDTAARTACMTGPLGMRVLQPIVREQSEAMARRVIVGSSNARTPANLTRLRRKGFAFTLDVLGESARSDACGERCVRTYVAILEHREVRDRRGVQTGDL